MRYNHSDGVHFICAENSGLFRSPPAMRLMPLGLIFLAIGLYVFEVVAVICSRKFEIATIFIFLFGVGAGALLAWIGIAGIRWAIAAAWGRTEITLDQGALSVRRTRPVLWDGKVVREEFCSTLVTDQFTVAHELLVMASGHRVVRVLSGRSPAELQWLANLIDSQLGSGFEPDPAETSECGTEGAD